MRKSYFRAKLFLLTSLVLAILVIVFGIIFNMIEVGVMLMIGSNVMLVVSAYYLGFTRGCEFVEREDLRT